MSVSGINIFFKQGGSLRAEETGHVELNFEGIRTRRTIREWTDMVRKEVDPNSGTFRCPVCGLDYPHGHSEDDIIRETVWRPAFENWIYERVKASGLNAGIGRLFAEGYYWGWESGFDCARKDGGWAERDGGLSAKYRYDKLQALWECWQAACSMKEVKTLEINDATTALAVTVEGE